MRAIRAFAIIPIAALILAACQGDVGASGSEPAATDSGTAVDIPAVVCVGEATTYLDWLNGDLQPDVQDPIEEPAATTGDLLETVMDRGVLRISTDANYEPSRSASQTARGSASTSTSATEIAKRLGVEAEFQHQDWDIITAGSWAERWDISVGSMTITTDRKDLFSFTQPYYYTPAYMAASTRSGVDEPR